MSITFSTCFYIVKSKFEPSIYIEWMTNFFSIANNNFNLVIYTDENSLQYIPKREEENIENSKNQNIKIIIKPFEQFYNYKYKDYWIQNHEKNNLLNNRIDWKVNMLWSEKIWFVNETIQNKYFDTDFYGWCDIGYFRNRQHDINTKHLINWPNLQIISNFDKNKIYYACINNNENYINNLYKLINEKNEGGVPINEIPSDQTSIAGGFFMLYKDKIDFWCNTYNLKLQLYFENNYLVKDDQIILVDCILSDLNHFQLYRENNLLFDNWFMFQRILL